MTKAIEALRSATAEAGPVYGPSNLHVTVRQFEAFRAPVSVADQALAIYADVLATFASRHPPVAIDFIGLNLARGGVLMQGWPCFDLRTWRRDLHRAADRRGASIAGPERSADRLRTTAHATLSILEAPPNDPEALIALVDAHRHTAFGRCTFDAIWLVGYRRVPGAIALVDYARFELAGPVA